MAPIPETGRHRKVCGLVSRGKGSFGCFLGHLYFQIAKTISWILPHLIREDFVLQAVFREPWAVSLLGPAT